MGGLNQPSTYRANGVDEWAAVFECEGCELLGILTKPHHLDLRIGVVIVVGGPQYRVGSHRQFTLLARHLAQQGIASLRFDYRGHGDSAGVAPLGVEGVEADLRVAIDRLLSEVPTLQSVVLWGLCGAATAAALYAASDVRVAGLVMLNPWVRTEAGLAKARLLHYYPARVADREFWRRIIRGEVAIGASLRSLLGSVKKVIGRSGPGVASPREPQTLGPKNSSATRNLRAGRATRSLPELLLAALLQTRTPSLVVLSGNADLIANEFRDLCSHSADWRKWLAAPHVQLTEVSASNHTFARDDWRDAVSLLTTRWVTQLGSG